MRKSERDPKILKVEKGNRLLVAKILRETQVCNTCKGSGMTVHKDKIIQDCPTCKGAGIISKTT